jgi:hypothetical protein
MSKYRHRNTPADMLLSLAVKGMFLFLVLYGLILYARYEWIW